MNLLDRMFLRPMLGIDDSGSFVGGSPAADNAWMADLGAELDPFSGLDYAPEVAPVAASAGPGIVTPDSFDSFYVDANQSALSGLDEADLFKTGAGLDSYVSRMSLAAGEIQFAPPAAEAFKNNVLGVINKTPVSQEQKDTYTQQILDSIRVPGVTEIDFGFSAPLQETVTATATATTTATTPDTPISKLTGQQIDDRLKQMENAVFSGQKVDENDLLKLQYLSSREATAEMKAKIAEQDAAKLKLLPDLDALGDRIRSLPAGSREQVSALRDMSKLRSAVDMKALDSATSIATNLESAVNAAEGGYEQFTASKARAQNANSALSRVLNTDARVGKHSVELSEIQQSLAAADNPKLPMATRINEANNAAAVAVRAQGEAAQLAALERPRSAFSLDTVNGYGEVVGTNSSAIGLYLSVFGAIAGPVLAAQESKKNRQFQMDLYNLQRQNAREDLQWQYDLRKAYGEDSASVAAAQASAGKAAAAPVSKAKVNISKAKVKVS